MVVPSDDLVDRNSSLNPQGLCVGRNQRICDSLAATPKRTEVEGNLEGT